VREGKRGKTGRLGHCPGRRKEAAGELGQKAERRRGEGEIPFSFFLLFFFQTKFPNAFSK